MTLNRYLLPWYWPCWLIVGLLRLLTHLPYRSQIFLGKVLGGVIYVLGRSARRIARINLDLCFPDWPQARKQKLLRQSFEALGIGVMEAVLGWWGSAQKLEGLLEVKGEAYLLEALGSGRGVMILGAHYTTIQIAGRLMALRYPIGVMFRPNKIGFVNFLIQGLMKKHYHLALEKEEVRGMLRALKQGHAIWYAADLSPKRRNAAFVSFFGIPTATLKGIAQFPKLTKAVVLPVSHIRKDDGSGYEVSFHPPFENFPSENLEFDLQRANDFIETQIRKKPEQYLWIYKRFKTRPAGEKKLYD